MADKKRVKIDDHEATEHNFPFKKYAQVIVDDIGNTGTVIDAEWIGNDPPPSYYTMTYWIKSNADGSVTEWNLADLLALNRNRSRN